ncbi:hypothetical protein ACUNV4_25335 [Granulosicoccus sp. 3-233]|uniref:hypothetical protein n=1 Tax=Granulosicoccus sp. 3-233 TaxID=3417969 RepID=UPI003D33B0EB
MSNVDLDWRFHVAPDNVPSVESPQSDDASRSSRACSAIPRVAPTAAGYSPDWFFSRLK